MASSSSASAPSWKYDVFLSFRGEETRLNFTDHLHKRLQNCGIKTFIDDQLRIGDQISPTLLQAIEDSRFSILIFSQNYASSSWCLDELTKIVECVDKGEHTAFHVFYEVDPSHVRHQRGSYEEAFRRHEEAHMNNMEKVVKWRQALTTACGYVGWDTRGRHQYDLISEIVSLIFNKLPANPSSSNMIGMDSHIEAMLSLLHLEANNLRMVGIWGMAGIGKTALAEAIYQRIRAQFEGCCFLSNVREKSQTKENLGMELLSELLKEMNLLIGKFSMEPDSIKKALHSKQVLIVLDDVDHIDQLEELVGQRDWFGLKSRIIITTRDVHLLRQKGVDEVYEAKELQKEEARMLFYQHAFKDESPLQDFEELCDYSLDYTKGNPLAIRILGRLLHKRTKNEWKCTLEKLQKFPNKEVQAVLRISFDGLEDNEKNIFLDIAFFLKEKDIDYASKLLKCCGFFPKIGISILVERALITISNSNRLGMHDLVQEMGREIVRQESIDFPGKRSRLWWKEDVEDVLATNSGTETIQGIVLDLSTLNELLDFHVDAFTKMIKLRVLRFHGMLKRSYYFGGQVYQMDLRGDLKLPSKNLRCLWWEGYPLKYLPSDFHPRRLFELNMSFSRLQQLWEGYKSFRNLEYMDLSYSQDLIRTPDLSGAPKLRKINLEGCTSLVAVDSSIETLEELTFLNLKGCSKLQKVAESLCKLTSLVTLNLCDCSVLQELPILISIKSLNLYGCLSLRTLPKYFGKLTSLETLNLKHCSKLEELPKEIGELTSLKILEAYGSGIQEVPHSISLLTRLEKLSLGCKGSSIDLDLSFFGGFQHLKELTLRDCNLLEVGAISSLRSLKDLDLSENSFISLPSLTQLTNLIWLKLEGCKSLRALARLPSSIEIVLASKCKSLQTFSHPPNSYAMSKYGGLMLDLTDCGPVLENEGSLEAILDGIRIFNPDDTAGWLRRTNQEKGPASLSVMQSRKSIMRAHVVALVLNAEEIVNARSSMKHAEVVIARRAVVEGHGLIVIVIKMDLLRGRNNSKLYEKVMEAVPEGYPPGYRNTSCIHISIRGKGRIAVMRRSLILTKNGRLSTARLNRWLCKVMSRHSWKDQAAQPKVKYFTQMKARPLTFIAIMGGKTQLSNADIRFLTKSLKDDFDLGGIPVRIMQRSVPNKLASNANAKFNSAGRPSPRMSSDKSSVSIAEKLMEVLN